MSKLKRCVYPHDCKLKVQIGSRAYCNAHIAECNFQRSEEGGALGREGGAEEGE